MGDITIISGPPCGGKTTYINENKSAGDIVIDKDKLVLAMGASSEYMYSGDVSRVAGAARSAAIDTILEGIDTAAWIIHSNPTADDVMMYSDYGARFVLQDPGIDVCLERAAARPEGTADAIQSWYNNIPSLPKYAQIVSAIKKLSLIRAAVGGNTDAN